METGLGIIIGMLAIVIALCAVAITNAITHAAETVAKAIKENK